MNDLINVEKFIECKVPLLLAFIDYRKAYVSVKHEAIIKALLRCFVAG